MSLKEELLTYGLTGKEADATILKYPEDVLLDAVARGIFKTKAMLKVSIKCALIKNRLI